MKHLLSAILLLNLSVRSQSILSNRYVDDRINSLSHLYFNPDSTFEYRYVYDLMGDEAIGRYKLYHDTLTLSYSSNTTKNRYHYFEHVNVRADSLIVKGHKLYEIKNGQSREYQKQDTIHHRPPNSWHYRRKYLLFGYWHSHYSMYYMIDERYAKWANRKWLRQNKVTIK